MQRVQSVNNYVVNQPSAKFSNSEMRVLNRSFNYAPKPKKLDIESSVVGIETAVKFMKDFDKEMIRKAAKPILKNAIKNSDLS